MIKIGIIGGSGLEDSRILKGAKEVYLTTKFGNPSGGLTTGKINDIEVVVIPRHGKRHTINPTNINYRANIMALKEQGCTHIIATSACGSLKEEVKPGDFIFCDQFIDRTTKRHQTFYDENKVCHIPMAEPFCGKLRDLLGEAASEIGLEYHKKGTVVTIEGPRFSTKAESHMFRQWGADVINMSTVPESVLAREAGICYAVVAMSTDYDVWKEHEDGVNIAMILQVMKQNAENVKKLLLAAIPKINYEECQCREDIKSAVIG
ncbi:S-methyl-5'-thioadenosine phosphorylase [Candidatus Woesearchaeota archaeon]|nr:S-methyl-5'-thioadenosine phosphorylase [Candidatus Woesearchaeota archaeon]